MPTSMPPKIKVCTDYALYTYIQDDPTKKPASEQGPPTDQKSNAIERTKKEIEGDNGPAGGSNAAIKPKL